MNLQDRTAKRFAELEKEMNALSHTINPGGTEPIYDTIPFQKWSSSVMHLIKSVFGEPSPHYQNIKQAYENLPPSVYWAVRGDVLKGIFKAAKEDFDGRYLFSVKAAISGEIFGDFVSLAKAALSESYKDVAAVLVCAALEDALKRYAALNDLDVNDKVMQEVVAAIKAKGLVTGAQKTLLDSMPKIRDYAMHAKWDKITSQDVGSVIGFVEQFLLTHFS
jgi:hypothetical protein